MTREEALQRIVDNNFAGEYGFDLQILIDCMAAAREIILNSQFKSEDMSEVGVEIIKTEETEECGIKYLNINVSNSEVERKPDIVRLCSDAGIIEYAKPKIGHWIADDGPHMCSCCKVGNKELKGTENYCPNCGALMLDEPQESEDKE